MASHSAIAQIHSENDTLWHIETKDGNHYIGSINRAHMDTIEVYTKLGLLHITGNQIKSMHKAAASQIVGGDYWSENPHANRYFWGPSGYGLRKGEAYYQNIWVLLNQISYGFTNNFSMGLGIIPVFFFGGDLSDTPLWITPKFAFPYKNGKGAFSAGTLLIRFLGTSDNIVGIVYGANTFGTRERQITAGIGYGYSSDDGFASTPTFSLSGMWRTGKKWAVVSENYLINAGGSSLFGFVSGGARYMGSSLAIDFGGFIPLGENGVNYVLPWLGITIPFK